MKISKATLELNAYYAMLRHYRKHNKTVYHYTCISKWRLSYGMYLVKCLEQIVEMLNKATKGSASELYNDEFLLRAANYYFERSSDPITSKEVVEDFLESVDNVRRCSVCGRLMQEGYCEDGGWRYYCSEECLHTKYSDAEWEEECERNEDSYWTTWD